MTIRVLIIGGGIAGCTAALSLHKKGYSPIIYERSPLPSNSPQPPSLGMLGGGFTLQSNGLRVLRHLGLLDQVRALGNSESDVGTFYTIQGKSIASFDMSAEGTSDTKASCHIVRSRLHDFMLAQVWKNSIPIYFGKTLTAIQDHHANGSVRVEFDDGSHAECDLVIGADGVHSSVRRHIFGHHLKAQFTGAIGYLGVVDLTAVEAESWRSYAKLCFFNDPVTGRFILVMDPTSDKAHPQLCFAVMESHPQLAESDNWRPYTNLPQETTRLSSTVADWGMPSEFIALVQKASRLTPVSIYEAPQLASYVKGRVLLMGDAAHGMRPDLGQGVNCALEDAGILAEILVHHSDDISEGLREFNQMRVNRCNGLVTEARERNKRSRASNGIGAIFQRKSLQFLSLLACFGIRPMVHLALSYDFMKEIQKRVSSTSIEL